MIQFPRIQSDDKSIGLRKSVHGYGINDAWYNVTANIDGVKITCPLYQLWSSILKDGKSKFGFVQTGGEVILDCAYANQKIIDNKWCRFSNFIESRIAFKWNGQGAVVPNLRFPGNSLYSDETCDIVPGDVAKILRRGINRMDLSVSYNDDGRKYILQKNGQGVFTSRNLDEVENVFLDSEAEIYEIAAKSYDYDEIGQHLETHAKLIRSRSHMLLDGWKEF